MAGRYDQKKHGPDKPGAAQEQEQDQEVQEQTPEHEQTRSHNTVGNQALSAMMNSRADAPTAGTEGGGGGRSVRRRKEPDKEGVDYGGDGDVDDVPLSLEDLTASWNPGIRKSDDRPRYVEPMPDDDLPPEDPDWLDAVGAAPHSGPLPRLANIDALLQPSAEIVARSMAGWCRAAGRWAAPSLTWRALAYILDHQAPVLQAPDARVLPARAALGALASCLLSESPAVVASPTIETGALIEFALELEGRAHRVANVINELDDQRAKLPRARDLLQRRLPESSAAMRPIQADPDDVTVLRRALDALVAWEPLEDNIPGLAEPPPMPESDEDPLGLDAFLEAELGGPRDVDGELYQAGLQSAEILASAASLTRIRWAAAAALVAEVAELWTGAPTGALLEAAGRVDDAVDGALRLLLEVARASQKRTVPPRGIHNGLRRGARQLDALRQEATLDLARLCAALLPGRSGAPAPVDLRSDPMSAAFYARAPAEALRWLDLLPPDLDRDVAALLVRAAAGHHPVALAELARAVRDRALHEHPVGPLGTALSILLAHALRHVDALEASAALGEAIQTVGRSRRNGLLVAEGAIIAIEALTAADRRDEAEATRLAAGRLCLDLGGRAGLSLLARWTPPHEEPADFAPFFDYPMDDADADAPDDG
jgi:hypothetical protein